MLTASSLSLFYPSQPTEYDDTHDESGSGPMARLSPFQELQTFSDQPIAASPVELSPYRYHAEPSTPSKPITIGMGRPSSSALLSPLQPQPRAMSYSSSAGVATSPAMAFLSCFSSPSPQPPPEEIAGYTLAETIGHGGFSTVRRAYSPSGGSVAVKIVKKGAMSKMERSRLQHEVDVWSVLSHEHILPLFSSSSTPEAEYFVTLYCPAGSLYTILQREGGRGFAQDDVGMMFRQVLGGLRYLHEGVGLVHRDVKLENVLVDEWGVCRLSDFGLAKRIGDNAIDAEDDDNEDLLGIDSFPKSETTDASPFPWHSSLGRSAGSSTLRRQQTTKEPFGTHLSVMKNLKHRNSTTSSTQAPAKTHSQYVLPPGSLPYAAPELLVPQTSSGPLLVQPAQDIWALGVLLYGMLTGKLPFVDAFEPRLSVKILQGNYQIPAGIGRGAERVLEGCLAHSVADRWTIAMVDDVAWGVGWGTADDNGAHDELVEDDRASRSRTRESKSRSRARYEGATPVSDHRLQQRQRSSDSEGRSMSSVRSAGAHRAPHMKLTTALETTATERGRRRFKSDAFSPGITHSASNDSGSYSPVPETPRDEEFAENEDEKERRQRSRLRGWSGRVL